MNRTLVETAIRNVLRIVGAAVAARGYAASADVEVIVGVLAVAAGEAWSFYEKHQRTVSDGTPQPPPPQPPEAKKED